jgi:nitroreductase
MNQTNPTLDTIHDLHTTHGDFDDRSLPVSDLQTVLEASVRAGSASNMQNYSIVVVQDREVMKSLCGYQASVLLLYCIDTNRMAGLARHLGCRFSTDPALMLTTFAVDTIMAAQTAAIAARSLGIDSLFTNGIHRGDPERAFSALELPERDCLPLIALLLGYARQNHRKRKGRLSGPGIIHYDRYHRPTEAECDILVAEYDDPGRNLGLIQDWHGKDAAHYLEWLFTKWCKPFDAGILPPSAMSTTLRKHGFIHDPRT